MRRTTRFLAGAAVTCCSSSVALAGDGTWKSPFSGNWNTSANWTGAVPRVVGDTATFNSLPNEQFDNDVTITSPVTVSDIVFNNPRTIRIFPNATLNLDGGAAGAAEVRFGPSGAGGQLVGQVNLATDLKVDSGFGTFVLDGNITGPGDIYFRGSQFGLGNTNYAGDTVLESGLVSLGPGATLGNTAGITIVGSQNVAIDLRTSLSETIRLENSTGFAFKGAIIARGGGDIWGISGTVDLGSIGSSIGGHRDIRFDGPVTGGGLSKVGTGSLTLTHSGVAYTGPTNVGENGLRGTLHIASAATLMNSSRISVNRAGQFSIVDSTSNPLTNRIGDHIPVTLNGGWLSYGGGSTGISIETLGSVTTARGFSTISSAQGNDTSSAYLTLNSFSRNSGAIIEFANGDRGTLGGTAANDPRILLATPPTLVGGIIGGWALATDKPSFTSDFATYDAARGVRALGAAGRPSQVEGASAGDNVLAVGPLLPLSQDTTINSLSSGVNLNLGGRRLTLASGGWLSEAFGGSSLISNGTLTAGAQAGAELFANIKHGTVTISARITDNAGGAVGLTKSGFGNLVLIGTNSYSGPTIVNATGLGSTERGKLTITTPLAIPADNDVSINGGEYNIAFETLTPLNLGTVAIRDNGFIDTSGPNPNNVTINADEYLVESGAISAKLAGSGPMIKTTDGAFGLGSDNSGYIGTIDVHGGILGIGGVNPLGGGEVRVHSGRHLVEANVGGNLELNGGELAGSDGTQSSGGVRTFSGPIRITDNSRILGFDGLAIDNVNLFTLNVPGDVTIDPGKSLTLLGARPPVLTGNMTLLKGALLDAPNSDLRYDSGKLLAGDGTINARTVTIAPGGQLQVGADLGILEINANYIQQSPSTLQIKITGNEPGTEYDQLKISGSANISGGLAIERPTGFIPQPGDEFQIMSYAGITNLFNVINGTYLGDGRFFEVEYGAHILTLLTVQAGEGDADLDGDVDLSDLGTLATHYGLQANADWLQGDFDNDGDIDLNDLGSLANNYGEGQARAFADFQALIAVPEPSVAWALVLMSLAACRKRRRQV